MKKIGILGGTFDPPHIGHFIIAAEVKYALQFDEIWFIPTNEPPHKSKAMTDHNHRLHMLKSVIDKEATFHVHTIELERKGKSYTIDTVNELMKRYPNVEFYFIIGADMVEYLPKWKNIDELIQKTTFVGVGRTNYSLSSAYDMITVKIPMIDISSTEIRDRIKRRLPIKYLLPKEIYTYIKEHHLYGYSKDAK